LIISEAIFHSNNDPALALDLKFHLPGAPHNSPDKSTDIPKVGKYDTKPKSDEKQQG
jgi:hypothetical protein